jgi:predicted transcriptional regulator of viral defense system
MNVLKQIGNIPVDFATLATIYGDYKFPKDKIAMLEKNSGLIRIKKGLYVVSPEVHHLPVSKELIANHLYGPSYISFEKALSWYNLIPERVYNIRSLTLKRSTKFSTPFGSFEYTTTTKDYFKIGLTQEVINNQYAFIIASPEKALCDMLLYTPGLRIQSLKAMQVYLEEDLRINLSLLETFNIEIINQCITVGKKKTELNQLKKLLEYEYI